MTSDDARFVAASWYKSYWRDVMCTKVEFPIYKQEMKRVINDILQRPKTQTLVAFASHEPDHILGFTCLEGPTLHYVFVKAAYRRMGVASGFITPRIRTHSHRAGKAGTAFLRFHGLKYNPFAIVEHK